MADVPVLTYFDGRGRSEIIRLFLTAANIKVRMNINVLTSINRSIIIMKLKMINLIFQILCYSLRRLTLQNVTRW